MCTGQNRNLHVQSLENNTEVIDYKFLFCGHSYLPNDADFGIIEMALRRKNFLYTLHYYDVIKQCRQKIYKTQLKMGKKKY